MTDKKSTQDKKESSTVSVIADCDVTFARKDYSKGDSIECTAEQAEMLAKQGIVKPK